MNHTHKFERFELYEERSIYTNGIYAGTAKVPYFIGYHCQLCGESGYALNLAAAVRVA